MKTNAVRLLEQAGIAHELRDYAVDESDLSAETVAAKVGLPPEQVLKTLVVRGARTGVVFAVLPAGSELDLKALARLASDRAMETVPLKEVQPLTGYIRGGVTALAAKKSYPVFVDESALAHPRVAVSAGVRGTQILLAPGDYVRVTRATTGAISRPKPTT
jgi:Cys-tRNA(Pro)/Cys-tRNA(Cys) deacylase